MKPVDNLQIEIEKAFNNKEDTTVLNFEHLDHHFQMVYQVQLSDITTFNNYYFNRLTADNLVHLETVAPGTICPLTDRSLNNLTSLVYDGQILLNIDDTWLYHVKLMKKPLRSITESQIDPLNMFASLDAFIEDAQTNIALVRKRFKSGKLNTMQFTLGSESQTTTYLLYHANQIKLASKIKDMLLAQKITTVSTINSIGQYFQGNKIVPMVVNTSSPENIVSAINKGRVAIIIDGSPVAIIVPVNFLTFTAMKREIDTPTYFSIFTRLLISMCVVTSIFSLGFLIAIINFHPNSLTILMIANIKATERGSTLPIFAEIIIVLALFDFYRYAVGRSPINYVQNIIIIIGGLFIGQNAVNSGIIGALALVLTAFSYLGGFAVTNNPHLITSFSILRFINLIASYWFGFLGFLISAILIACYLAKIKSFGLPFLYPIIPFNRRKLKNYYVSEESKEFIQ